MQLKWNHLNFAHWIKGQGVYSLWDCLGLPTMVHVQMLQVFSLKHFHSVHVCAIRLVCFEMSAITCKATIYDGIVLRCMIWQRLKCPKNNIIHCLIYSACTLTKNKLHVWLHALDIVSPKVCMWLLNDKMYLIWTILVEVF